jgi:phage baseplate assembly protein W
MTYTVKAGTAAVKLNETDTVKSVLQNIAIILRTRRGSCPLYREFGLPMEFLDRPQPVAKTMAIAEIKEVVETFEPRATVEDISFEEDVGTPGVLIPIVEVSINA